MMHERAETQVLSAENSNVEEQTSLEYSLSPQHSLLSTGV